MEEPVKKALEDVGEIKKLLRQTVGDFSSATRLFVTAGLFWMVKGLLELTNVFGIWRILSGRLTAGQRVAVFSYLSMAISLVGWIAVLVVYLRCRGEQKRCAQGLGLQLIDCWGCLLLGMPLYVKLAQRVTPLFFRENVGVYDNIPYLFFAAALPLLLMATGILMDNRIPKLLALGYLLVSLVLFALPSSFDYAIGEGILLNINLPAILSASLLPGAFLLILGLLLRSGRERS